MLTRSLVNRVFLQSHLILSGSSQNCRPSRQVQQRRPCSSKTTISQPDFAAQDAAAGRRRAPFPQTRAMMCGVKFRAHHTLSVAGHINPAIDPSVSASAADAPPCTGQTADEYGYQPAFRLPAHHAQTGIHNSQMRHHCVIAGGVSSSSVKWRFQIMLMPPASSPIHHNIL